MKDFFSLTPVLRFSASLYWCSFFLGSGSLVTCHARAPQNTVNRTHNFNQNQILPSDEFCSWEPSPSNQISTKHLPCDFAANKLQLQRATTIMSFGDYRVADINLGDYGRKDIELAEAEMVSYSVIFELKQVIRQIC